MSSLTFDATAVNPNLPDRDAIPAGDYQALIESSEVKPTSKGGGQYLELVWQILAGEHRGRKIWHRITVQNQTQRAVEIGLNQLSNVCHAVGVLNVTDTAQLHDKPCLITVGIEKDKTGQYGDKNVVKKCASLSQAGGAAPAADVPVTTTAHPPQQQPTAGGGGQPWISGPAA